MGTTSGVAWWLHENPGNLISTNFTDHLGSTSHHVDDHNEQLLRACSIQDGVPVMCFIPFDPHRNHVGWKHLPALKMRWPRHREAVKSRAQVSGLITEANATGYEGETQCPPFQIWLSLKDKDRGSTPSSFPEMKDSPTQSWEGESQSAQPILQRGLGHWKAPGHRVQGSPVLTLPAIPDTSRPSNQHGHYHPLCF